MKQKGNKLSAYWVLQLLLSESSVLSLTTLLLVVIVGLFTLPISTSIAMVVVLFLVYYIGKLENTINVLMGKCDIEKFHDTQDHLCIVLGFDKDGKLLFGELVSDFEAKMLNAMQRRSLLNVKNKRVDLIETFNYNELNEGERNTLYIDRADQNASALVYHSLLSERNRAILMQDIEDLTINGS